ncbi:MAG TPA: hypothetical protein H9987_08620 [Candidatus Luteococcus avicola]|nr:hypothetical protein [Candidatus Luteococcus avicola]
MCLGMLRGGFGAANVALLVAAAGCGMAHGGVGALNAAAAGVIVLLFAASGQAVQMVAAGMADSNGMVLVLGSYLARVAALGGMLWLAMEHQERVEPLLDRTCVMVGALAVLAGWLGGVLWTHAHQRVSVFDSQWRARADTGQSGSVGRRQGTPAGEPGRGGGSR